MKIILVNPSLTAKEQAGNLEVVENVMRSLGIGYIAAVLEKNNFNVEIIDSRVDRLSEEQLIAQLKEKNPDVIGFTSTILEINRVVKLSNKIKKEKLFPNSKLILGGPQFTSNPEETMRESGFDIGVYGEGEYSFLELCKALEAKASLREIKGLYIRENGKIIFTGQRELIQNLDELPFPARHLYPALANYRPVPASYIRSPVDGILTSRGCPYKCIFCDHGSTGRSFRARSAKSVVDELEFMIKESKIKEFRIYDDTFTLNRQRVVEICNEIINRKLNLSWCCMTRVNHVDLELLKLMKKAGCWQVHFGLESGDQRMLNIMKKGVTVQQNRDAVIWAKKAGLNVRVFFVLGIPGETKESMRTTIEFAKSLPIDVATFYAVTLYPGNELFEIAKKGGKVLHNDYSQYNPLIDEKTHLAYVPEGMTEEEFKSTVTKSYKEFYFRPRYLLNQVLSIRRINDLKRYWMGFKAVKGMK